MELSTTVVSRILIKRQIGKGSSGHNNLATIASQLYELILIWYDPGIKGIRFASPHIKATYAYQRIMSILDLRLWFSNSLELLDEDDAPMMHLLLQRLQLRKPGY